MTRRGWALFAAMCLIWGVPYLFIKIAVESVSPAVLVFLRCALAAGVLLPIALARHELPAVLPRFKPLVAFAVVEIMAPWLLLGHAEQRVASSLAGLVIASVPLVGALAFLLTPHAERYTPIQAGGLVLGFIGVASLVGLDLGQLDPVAIAELLSVATCYAMGPLILAKWFSDLPGLAVNASALAVAAVSYAPAAISDPPSGLPLEAWGSVLVLGLVCTALAFVIFVKLISEAGPTRPMLITYFNPAVAITLGVVLLDERLTTGMMVGLPLILLGSIIATTSGGRRTRPLPEGPATEAAR